MGMDEESTHKRLRAHFTQLVNPKIKEHKGRTVKTRATACWRSSPVLLTPCAALPKYSAG
jgi:hypothetical protein